MIHISLQKTNAFLHQPSPNIQLHQTTLDGHIRPHIVSYSMISKVNFLIAYRIPPEQNMRMITPTRCTRSVHAPHMPPLQSPTSMLCYFLTRHLGLPDVFLLHCSLHMRWWMKYTLRTMNYELWAVDKPRHPTHLFALGLVCVQQAYQQYPTAEQTTGTHAQKTSKPFLACASQARAACRSRLENAWWKQWGERAASLHHYWLFDISASACCGKYPARYHFKWPLFAKQIEISTQDIFKNKVGK